MPKRKPRVAHSAVEMIVAERNRQTADEGWTEAHDDTHTKGELAQAAACYAWVPPRPLDVKEAWPWQGGWKPELGDVTSRERVLVKAGALIVAEIERLQRAAARRPAATPEGA